MTPKEQIRALKAKHGDVLCLMREGDNYVAYDKDAEIVAENDGIGFANPCESFKFQYSNLDSILPKLIRAGHRVAICETLEK
jgi:DNA mismatch repair protein MutS